MEIDKTLKILIIGPSNSGKTCVSNYLAGRANPIQKTYIPTQGVRCLEFEKTVYHSRHPTGEIWTCQIWDMAGDSKFESCWPAIQNYTNGVIICYNGDIKQNDEEFLGWIKCFPHKMNIAPCYCIGFAHHPSGNSDFEQRESTKFGLSIYHSSIENGLNTIVPAFDKLTMGLVEKFYSDMEDSEEQEMETYAD